jgi:hypothetical protein
MNPEWNAGFLAFGFTQKNVLNAEYGKRLCAAGTGGSGNA